MGEARRKKLAGNTEPNPKYRRNRRTPNYVIERESEMIAMQLMGGILRKHRLPRF